MVSHSHIVELVQLEVIMEYDIALGRLSKKMGEMQELMNKLDRSIYIKNLLENECVDFEWPVTVKVSGIAENIDIYFYSDNRLVFSCKLNEVDEILWPKEIKRNKDLYTYLKRNQVKSYE